MKILKQLTVFLFTLVLMASFSQCSSAQKLQKKPPMPFGEVYLQNWFSGVEGGGSGINVYIPVQENAMSLDSMFFRKQRVKLEFIEGENPIYVGRFKTEINQPKDLVLSSDMSEESKHNRLNIEKDMPFELQDDECVVSYKKGNRTYYYKISNILVKEPIHYPSAPRNGQ